MAKRRSKSGTKKKRKKKYGGPGSTKGEAEPVAGGVMQGMVGGFRRAVGAEKPKKKSSGRLWTVLLLLALAAVVYWRFFRGG